MKFFSKARLVLFTLIVTLGYTQAQASSTGCPDASSALMDSICFDCFFPVEIAGVVVSGSAKDLPDVRAPSTCLCPGRFGYMTEGYTVGAWYPRYFLETTRMAGCSTVLGGTNILGSSLAKKRAAGPDQKSSDYHVTMYAYPLNMVIDMLPSSVCTKPQNNQAFNIEYISVLDPSFSNEELANNLTPDSALFGNTAAIMACMTDAVASTVSKPIDALYYCVGSWGNLFPLTGHTEGKSVPSRDASLVGVRAIANQHRNGDLPLTYGPLAVCFNIPWVIMPKQQYRFTQSYPLPETKKSRWMGSNVIVTGLERRQVPVTGEDFVQTVWRFEQCCANF